MTIIAFRTGALLLHLAVVVAVIVQVFLRVLAALLRAVADFVDLSPSARAVTDTFASAQGLDVFLVAHVVAASEAIIIGESGLAVAIVVAVDLLCRSTGGLMPRAHDVGCTVDGIGGAEVLQLEASLGPVLPADRTLASPLRVGVAAGRRFAVCVGTRGCISEDRWQQREGEKSTQVEISHEDGNPTGLAPCMSTAGAQAEPEIHLPEPAEPEGKHLAARDPRRVCARSDCS